MLDPEWFRKSDQSFLRIEFSDKDNVNQKFLRPYNQPMPAKIVIRKDGFKRFQKISVQTQVGFRIPCQFWWAWVISMHGSIEIILVLLYSFETFLSSQMSFSQSSKTHSKEYGSFLWRAIIVLSHFEWRDSINVSELSLKIPKKIIFSIRKFILRDKD